MPNLPSTRTIGTQALVTVGTMFVMNMLVGQSARLRSLIRGEGGFVASVRNFLNF